ncbi:RNA binding [Abeliophyllum distichum]|uniref:RNA binding n=1 Tax=Abeliophyllum distichum TaxID=126358 RepID=A0ABD1RPB0_9LAMI
MLQLLDSKDSGLRWIVGFEIGYVIEGKVHETKDFSVVITFERSIVMCLASYHIINVIAETTLERGSIIRASVLDVSKIEHPVDLSLKPEVVDRSKGEISTVLTHKKKRKREAPKELEVNQTVNAVVEIEKEN